MLVCCSLSAAAQNEREQNRPYTDLRPFHFGVAVGTHLQDIMLNNVGPTLTMANDGTMVPGNITADQDNWSIGFQVGVLGEARINDHFAFRMAPTLYFGSRHLKFRNMDYTEDNGMEQYKVQDMKSVYVGCDFELIYSALRHNNHRPYIMAGIVPMMNLTSKADDYIQLKKQDFYVSVGLGCDFYLPFFKLRPELKFMYSLTNALEDGRATGMEDKSMIPYSASVNRARTKMFCLTFYFE